jgi:hypothetical protein
MHYLTRFARLGLAGCIALFPLSPAFAQVVSVDAVGFAGAYSDYYSSGPTYQYHGQNLTSPVSGSWIDQTSIHDASTPGIGTVGSLSYNVNGGHIGVSQHMYTEQTFAAADNAYVSVYTRIGSVDYVTITGQPLDTAVNVNILFAITGNVDGDYGANLSRSFAIHSTRWGTAARLDFTGVHLANGEFNESFGGTVIMYAGRPYQVGSEISFYMFGTGGAGQTAFSTLDSTHSSNIRLYPQGTGLGVSSFSGFDYTSAVPEPSVTLGAGTTLLFALAHFYRRRHRASHA